MSGRVVLVIVLVVSGLDLVADERPKIGLALSGGGAKGYAHIGVLAVLEELHIPVDYIAGTSMGAVIGALYASGMSPEEIEREVAIIDWHAALTDATDYPQLTFRRKLDERRYPSTAEFGIKDRKLAVSTGVKTGQKLAFLLSRYLLPQLGEHDFSKFPTPFAAVATDLETGEAVVLAEGDIAEAVRASMSIPAVFTPVEIDGRILVDGGSAMNVPVDLVREMGADIVIAIDIGQPLSTRENLNSALAIVDQLSTMLTRSNMTPQLEKADLVLTPNIAGISMFALQDSVSIVPLGREAAEARRDELEKFAIDSEEFARHLARKRVARDREIIVDAIRVEGAGFVNEQFIVDHLKVEIGKPLDLDVLETDVEWLYGSDDYLGIHFGIEESGGETTLVIRIKEKPWGPNYLKAGLSVTGSTSQTVGINVLLNYTKRWINRRGAEWKTDLSLGKDFSFKTEIYQPRGVDRPGFARAGLWFREERLDLFQGEDAVAIYELRQDTAYADLGLTIKTWGEVYLGLLYRRTEAFVEVGSPEVEAQDESGGAISFGFELDTLDNPFIPHNGYSLSVRAVAPLEEFNSDETYVTTTLDFGVFKSIRKSTFSAGVSLQDSFSGEPAFTDYAPLGGFLNHGGFDPGQLIDKAGALLQLGYLYQIKERSILGKGVYVGGFLEAGDVGEDLGDAFGDLKLSGTATIGMNTGFGPVFFAISKAEGLSPKGYVTIGRSF